MRLANKVALISGGGSGIGRESCLLFARECAKAARRNRRLVHIPPGRFARAEEMANAALFLASDESSYVNGSTFLDMERWASAHRIEPAG